MHRLRRARRSGQSLGKRTGCSRVCSDRRHRADDWTRASSALFNVTTFFRDPPAWDYVRDEVIPSMLAERRPNDPIRVRSVGCASGRKASSPKRGAAYDGKTVESVPPELPERYFEPVNGALRVSRRSPPRSHFRPQRPCQGRAHPAGGLAGAPKHPDVSQRGDCAKCAGPPALCFGPPRNASSPFLDDVCAPKAIRASVLRRG